MNKTVLSLLVTLPCLPVLVWGQAACTGPGELPFPNGPNYGAIASVQNAALPYELAAGPLAPGEWASLFGTNLSYQSATGAVATASPNGSLPTTLAGTSVIINGEPAPILYLGVGGQLPFLFQLNFQVPYDIDTSKDATIQLMMTPSPGTTCVGPARQIPTSPLSPAYFEYNGAPIVQNALTGSLTNFTAGDYILIYLNGLGAVNGTVTAGTPPTVAATVKATVAVTIDGKAAELDYAGVTPGSDGVYQLNVRLPAGLGAGSHTAQVTVNGVAVQLVAGGQSTGTFLISTK